MGLQHPIICFVSDTHLTLADAVGSATRVPLCRLVKDIVIGENIEQTHNLSTNTFHAFKRAVHDSLSLTA